MFDSATGTAVIQDGTIGTNPESMKSSDSNFNGPQDIKYLSFKDAKMTGSLEGGTFAGINKKDRQTLENNYYDNHNGKFDIKYTTNDNDKVFSNLEEIDCADLGYDSQKDGFKNIALKSTFLGSPVRVIKNVNQLADFQNKGQQGYLAFTFADTKNLQKVTGLNQFGNIKPKYDKDENITYINTMIAVFVGTHLSEINIPDWKVGSDHTSGIFNNISSGYVNISNWSNTFSSYSHNVWTDGIAGLTFENSNIGTLKLGKVSGVRLSNTKINNLIMPPYENMIKKYPIKKNEITNKPSFADSTKIKNITFNGANDLNILYNNNGDFK